MGSGWFYRALAALALLCLSSPWADAQVRPKAVLQNGHPGGVMLAGWSHDSRYLVTVGSPWGAQLRKAEVIVWDVAAGTVVDRLDIPENPIPSRYRPGKQETCLPHMFWLIDRLTVDAADRVTLWGEYDEKCGYKSAVSFGLRTRKWSAAVQVRTLPPEPPDTLPSAPDGSWVISTADNAVVVVPAVGGRIFRQIDGDEGVYSTLIWWPDGQRFALLDGQFVLRIRNLASGAVERTIALPDPFERAANGQDTRELMRVNFAPDRSAVTLWVRDWRMADRQIGVPVTIATDSFAVSAPGAAQLLTLTPDQQLTKDWPEARSADHRFIHVSGGNAKGVARTASLDPPLRLEGQEGELVSADVTTDGRRIAFLRKPPLGDRMVAGVLDIDGLTVHDIVSTELFADTVRWNEDGTLLISKRLFHSASDGPRPVLLVDPAPGGRMWTYERRCAPAYFKGGMLAHGTCRVETQSDQDLSVATFDREGWRKLILPGIAGNDVIDLAGAADAPRALITTCKQRNRDGGCIVALPWLIDTRTMTVVAQGRAPLSNLYSPRLSADGRRLFVDKDNGDRIAFALPADPHGTFDLVQIAPDPVELALLNREAGALPDQAAIWERTDTNILAFSHASDHREIAQLIALPEGAFTVTTPYGTYDTTRPPEYAGIDWLFPDTPMKSLPVEIFMRDYLEPNLLSRRLDCTKPNTCAKVFRPAPDLSTLNRTLPRVEIRAVVAGNTPGTAEVSVVAYPTVDPAAPAGRQGSGLYNLRLYRGDRLVGQDGAPDAHLDPDDRAGWQRQTMLAAPGSKEGVAFHFTVPLPPVATAHDVTFRAYAFNESRVKSLTATVTLAVGGAPPPRPRLYLLTIGIDAYAGGGFPSLRYAGKDAQAMAEMLKRLAPAKKAEEAYEVHAESVIGTEADPATRERIRAAFLRLRAARPGDTVVIAYAGHGYTDAQGRFSLVPSDARSLGGAPDPASLITAGDLTEWLAPVDAAEVAFIIDACHSAASVNAGGFKPGPMGDPGLGQLAYDKGIRILAASQPDQYAMELSSIGHGLLTYTLVEQGAAAGKADLDRDGFITLDELLRYAARALQSFDAPSLGGEDNASLVVNWPHDVRPQRQKPSLFDYVGAPAASGLRLP
jgi:hypothetical protein